MMTVTRSVQGDAVRDQRIERLVPLVSPQELFDEMPLEGERTNTLLRGRAQTHAVLDGEDDRLLVIVGPCSVHDPDACREYAQRLSAEARRLSPDLLIAMRVYFELRRDHVLEQTRVAHIAGADDGERGWRVRCGHTAAQCDRGHARTERHDRPCKSWLRLWRNPAGT